MSFRSADELRTIIRNSTIENSEHHLEYMARPYRGPTLTFVENPNPHLFDDLPASRRYQIHTRLLPADDAGNPSMSRGFIPIRWDAGALSLTIAQDHFKYSTVPLTYAGSPPQPCIWNLASHAEYLWELSSRLHKLGKILFANGVHPDRVMLGFDADAMGCEGTPVYTLGESFYAPHVAADTKPYCYLNASGKSTPRRWNWSLLGISAQLQHEGRRATHAQIRSDDHQNEPSRVGARDVCVGNSRICRH